MMNDPVVQILREAAARGRQLRLACEQAAQSEIRSNNTVAEEQLPDQAVGVSTSLQHHDDVVKENSI